MFNIDSQQLVNLLTGIIGIYITYCLSGVVHEWLFKGSYMSVATKKEEPAIQCPEGLLLVPAFLTWGIGFLYNKIMFSTRTHIPYKNSALAGFTVFISSLTYGYAVIKTSYPVIMVFKSSNILSVLIVAIFCTRVKEKSLNLGKNKFITGGILAFGVFIYNFFDPEKEDRTTTSQFLGIFFVIISMVADGFLPDFQAEIKAEFKPRPTEMMVEINKCVCGFCLIFLVLSGRFFSFWNYIYVHPTYARDLVLQGFLSFVGQLFIYRMIKQFKQHIVPFVTTSRKIMTILISVFTLDHDYNPYQFIGIGVIILAVTAQFISQLRKDERKLQKFQKVIDWKEDLQHDSELQTERNPLDLTGQRERIDT